MKTRKARHYDISINKNCPNCILRHGIYMRCEEHREHHRQHQFVVYE